MALLRPFSGFIPSAEYARRVVGPPTSMLTDAQQNLLRDDELSFRHRVGRGAKAPLQQAMLWLQHSIGVGALQPVERSVIIYRLTHGDFSATGFLADVSINAYNQGHIKRHEATIAKSQAKMVKYMQSTRIFGNPVALAHRVNAELRVLLGEHTGGTPDVDFEAIDGARHELWIVGGAPAESLCAHLNDDLYITDGHHRLAAASWLAEAEGTPDAHLPAAVFAEDELTLGAYARSITDGSLDGGEFLDWLRAQFPLQEVDALVPRPSVPKQVGVRIDHRSFLLDLPADLIPCDLYEQLDVNLLRDLILGPFAGVVDPRTDERMQFRADTADAELDVDGCTAWFLPYPPSVPDVMAVADSGQTMPPKSTFFLPKVPSGLVVRLVDGDDPATADLP